MTRAATGPCLFASCKHRSDAVIEMLRLDRSRERMQAVRASCVMLAVQKRHRQAGWPGPAVSDVTDAVSLRLHNLRCCRRAALFVFKFHLHVNPFVFLGFKIDFQAVFTVTFLRTGVIFRVRDVM